MNRLRLLILIIPAIAVVGMFMAFRALPGFHPSSAGNELSTREQLCVDGHPRARYELHPNITYGGLLPRHGFERDHIVPLCLGGADTRDNLQYQPWSEARTKDDQEWHACDDYCAGRLELDPARAQFKREYQ